MTEPKGIGEVSRSITKDGDNRERNNLAPTEQSRLRESATIIGKILKIGAFAEGPEASKLGDLTANADKFKSISGAIRSKMKPIAAAKEEGDSLVQDILEQMGLEDLQEKWELLKPKLMEKLNRLVFAPLKNILRSIGTKLWNSIKWVGTKIWQGVKWLGTKISKTISSLVNKIKNSKFYKGMMSFVGRAADGIKNLWDDALRGIKGFIDNLVKGITSLKDGALELVKKIPGYDLVKKGIERTAQAGRAVGSAVVRAGSAVVRAGSAVGGAVRGAADDVAKGVAQVGRSQISKALGAFLGKGAAFIGKALKRIPIIGPLIEALFTAGDIKGFKDEYAQGAITLDELQFKIGNRIVKAIGAVAGAAVGGALGTLIPVPGLGTALGAVGGGELGRWLAGLFVEKLASPDLIKKLGSFFQGEQAGGGGWYRKEPGEMQDFIVSKGRVYKFNTKDEVLGMKTGGAIDNLMAGLTQGLARDNSIIKDASIAQVNKLDELVYLMTELLKKPVSSPVSMGIKTGQSFKTVDTRGKYKNHTLITP